MPRIFGEASTGRFLLVTFLPIITGTLALGAIVTVLLFMAAKSSDDVAIERQVRLVELIVSQMQAGLAHDQESVTVWDDAVAALESATDEEWIDYNLGAWMSTYFGHDQAYILGPEDQPVYAFAQEERHSPSAFASIASQVLPLVSDLRLRLKRGDTEGVTEQVLSIGASDVTVVAGRPSVVSVKPIISDTGEIEQKPGGEFLHVAVRHLDGRFAREIERDYLLENFRFSWSMGPAASITLKNREGNTLGYMIWEPFLPGTAMKTRILPALMALCLGGVAALVALMLVLRRRSVRLVSSEATVYHLAHHDLLTDLPNRGLFSRHLSQRLRKITADEQLAVLYLDLDHFKEVNDSYGHPAGDGLLREFADRLRRLIPTEATVARLGGDEFMILIPGMSTESAITEFCDQLIRIARQPFEVGGAKAFIGVSIGVSVAPRDGLDEAELIRRADVALYEAKRAGRAKYAVYDLTMDENIGARREIERDLRAALEDSGQLAVFYQPLFLARSGEMVGVEALVRWQHPAKGWITPETFIPVAEETGLIERLGEWVLREACGTTAGWSIETVAVNVSAVEMRAPHYALRVANILLEFGMNPRRLELELTESALSDKGGECGRNVAALRQLGVRIALDDFGTGFSSLGRLHLMQVDRIKIDRSFVNGFGKENGDEAIVQAIVDLARAKGLKTTAEGVETESQSQYLQRVGCDELQGYFLSRPMSAADLAKIASPPEKAHNVPTQG